MYLRLSPYQEILQSILTDLAVNEGIIKLTGKSGAGKTALCAQLFHEIESSGQLAVFFLKTPASATALQNNILDSLKLDHTGNFTRTLTAYLREKVAKGKPLVLIFDDAHNLDQQSFSTIRMLCNIQDSTHALIRVILCGNEELDRKLAGPTLRAVTQFLSQSLTLPYLTREQVRDFCQGYWLQTASDMKPMSEKVQQKLFQETQGQPGILQARLKQESTGADKLERSKDGAKRGPGSSRRPGKYAGEQPGWVPAALILGGLVLIGGTGAYLYLAQETAGAAAASATTTLPPIAQPAVEPVVEPVVEPDAAPLAAAAEITPAMPLDLALPPTAPSTPGVGPGLASTEATVAETAAAEQSDSAAGQAAPGLATDAAAQSVALPAAPGDADEEPQIPGEPAVAAAPAAATQDTRTEQPGAAPSPLPAPETFIAAWAASWQRRDVDAYLAYYHPDFRPAQGITLAEWQDQRRRVIGSAGEIMLSVEPPEFSGEAQDGMRIIRFWLQYSTATYADRTLKELVLVPVDADWRILRENNLRTDAQ